MADLSPRQEIGSRIHIKSLDGVRGLAFLLVYYYHFGPEKPFPILWGITWSGVDLFLVLSGFLITGILLDTRGHFAYFKNFYARRTLRIFPLYYAVLLVLLLLTPLIHTRWNIWELSYPFYASNIALHFASIGIHPQFDIQHLWSLALEEQFYLVWPLILWLVPNRRKLILLCGGLIGVALLLRFLFATHILDLRAPYDFNYVMLPTRMDTLVAGGLLAILIRSPNASRWLRHARLSLWIWLALLACVLGITRSSDLHNPIVNTLGFSLLAALFTSLIAHALALGSLAERIFQFSALRSIGKYSYGMYIFHELFHPAFLGIHWLASWLASSGAIRVLFALIWLVAVYCIAWLSYTAFESRFIQLKRHFPYHVGSTERQAAGSV